MILECITNNWKTITAISALFVSVAATFIAFYALLTQRKHNHKSLKPYIYIAAYDYEDNLLVTIRNEGTGPAIINSIQVQNNENTIKNSIFEWMPKSLPGKMNYKEYLSRYKDFVLRQGSEEHMLEIPIDTDNLCEIKERENLRKMLGNLTISVKYEDVYENMMPVYKRNLNYFSRTDNEN